MAKIMWPGVHRVTAKGRTYHYFGRGKGRVRLPDPADAVAFARAYEAARAAQAQPEKPPAGTVAHVIAEYRASAAFAKLSPSTRKDYEWALGVLLAKWGKLPVAGVKRFHVVRLQDKYSATPRQADRLVRVFSTCLAWGVARGHAAHNPAQGVRGVYQSTPIPPWTDDDLKKFRAAWAIGTPERLAVEIGAGTGLRGVDVRRLQWSDVKDGWITVTQAKTGDEVSIPILAEVKAVLDAAPKISTHVLTSARRKPYTLSGFEAMIERATYDAKIDRSFHGLRKYAAVRLVEAGCTVEEARAITGHRTDAMLRRYAQTARGKVLATAAVEKLNKRR